MATTHTLRNNLMQIMKDLKDGKITTKEAQAASKLASQVVYSIRVELENKRMELKYNNSTPSNCHTVTIPNIKL